MKVITTEYGSESTILYNLDPYVGKSIKISDAGVDADATTGKKIVKAGSFVSAAGAIVTDNTARYVVLQDVDVTYGERSATGIYRGTVHNELLPVAVTAVIKEGIPGVVFMTNDGNY